ncbi:MAG: bifunctional ADP-dependent NAD(P)H-hydrate dehydratase/NAD(P)H-hydrate epimerase, partial [Cyclobacteriaceae bacterium]|nr:bifunctional ADP-dependent NAD(P)H-hydrate dehydratase/NAD(P)H-hydrate epimerase [Cyclobacteriaceae bacterium]
MKIFSAEQIRKADQYNIKEEPIKSIDLMERASMAFVKWFELNFDAERRVIVFCGTGNNGGDGLAIGRILSFKGWNVHTLTVKKSSKQSLDFTMNYLKLAEVRDVPDINSADDFTFDIQP